LLAAAAADTGASFLDREEDEDDDDREEEEEEALDADAGADARACFVAGMEMRMSSSSRLLGCFDLRTLFSCFFALVPGGEREVAGDANETGDTCALIVSRGAGAAAPPHAPDALLAGGG
jgi:hypothetical protein